MIQIERFMESRNPTNSKILNFILRTIVNSVAIFLLWILSYHISFIPDLTLVSAIVIYVCANLIFIFGYLTALFQFNSFLNKD